LLKAKASQGELLTIALTDLLYDLFHEDWRDEPPDLVIGAPHHWTDGLRRSHIASQTAAARLAARMNRPLASRVIVKQRLTVRQATLVPTARRTNLADAFRLRRSVDIRGRRIMLVDDVLTTGTTAHRLASLLIRRGGAQDVRVCVLARGLGQY
jgi:predicted amidophosphoribosyltransferase